MTQNQTTQIAVQKGEIYYHYKYFTNQNLELKNHYIYKIIGLAGNASGDNYAQIWVVYEPLQKTDHLKEFGVDCYIRPLAEFLETVTVDDCQIPRFTKANYMFKPMSNLT